MNIAACVLLAATTALASEEPFAFSPRSGSPAGGDAVTITANLPSIDFTTAVPAVWFGEIASPRVTVLSAKTLTVTTPAHGEGVVTVKVSVAGASYESTWNFAFALPREPVLIPVAIETAGWLGAQWTTEISVFNDTNEPINLMPEVCSFIGASFPCNNPLFVGPHVSLRIPPRLARPGETYFERYLYPPDAVRDRLHFSVRVRNRADANDAGTEIPVVPLSRYRHERIVLSAIPVSDSHRALLRVYDRQRIAGASIAMRVYDEETGSLLLRRDTGFRPFPTDNPAMFSSAYDDLLRDPAVRGHRAVRIEIEEFSADLWAMLTLTDNETQRVTVITSQ